MSVNTTRPVNIQVIILATAPSSTSPSTAFSAEVRDMDTEEHVVLPIAAGVPMVVELQAVNLHVSAWQATSSDLTDHGSSIGDGLWASQLECAFCCAFHRMRKRATSQSWHQKQGRRWTNFSVCAGDSRTFLSDLQLCSGHGKCVPATGMCACYDGFGYGGCHRLQEMLALTCCFVGARTVLQPQRLIHRLLVANPLSITLLLLQHTLAR